jgi:hypothetical protein
LFRPSTSPWGTPDRPEEDGDHRDEPGDDDHSWRQAALSQPILPNRQQWIMSRQVERESGSIDDTLQQQPIFHRPPSLRVAGPSCYAREGPARPDPEPIRNCVDRIALIAMRRFATRLAGAPLRLVVMTAVWSARLWSAAGLVLPQNSLGASLAWPGRCLLA